MTVAAYFVKLLENEGIEYIFGIPGEENIDFIEALKDSSIKLILTRHEQAAGFMAATFGRLTGKPGVCLATLGPGATNLITAAAYAQLGGMPMLMITGQKPIKDRYQGLFQLLDIVDIMRPVTKFTKQIIDGNNLPVTVKNVFRIARDERPGCVHLELPEDIAQEEIEGNFVLTENYLRRPYASPVVIEMAKQMIEEAKSPMIVIGSGANRKRTSKALTDFILSTKIPFATTQMGKGVIDERSEYYLGCAALSDNDFLHCALSRADLIINIGHDTIEKPPFMMSKEGDQKVIHINFFPAELDEVYFPQLEVIGDIAHSIQELSEIIEVQRHWDFSYYQRIKVEIDNNTTCLMEDRKFPMYPQHIVQIVRNVLPSDGIVCLDNGMYKIWFARNYKCHYPNTLLLDNALATMGAGLSSAIATKMLYPQRSVICVCGDGGFMMNSQELETASRLKINLVIIVLRDNAFGMIKWKQEARGFQTHDLDYTNPDLVEYANSYDNITGHRPETVQGFERLLKKTLKSKGVHLIDLVVDYSKNHEYLDILLKNKTCIL
ncbi:acetolactate synthase large subunit [Aureivirga sp. CE67]|uniref:acetolactate synthase large subunit n=1 Tax=Aureivirga sp. CE67 TaxID=1788983 RepID=UPI0018C974A1|nr:acetolactate synthase large subunit [Aureivirga sp. CE67]